MPDNNFGKNTSGNAFNMSMNTGSFDQSVQVSSDLEKATAAIGEAERKAEEDLAKRKLTNLIEQQKIKLKQLERLRSKEEEGIRQLSELRHTLSDKQFNVQKIKLEKELKRVKDAVDDLVKLEEELTKKTSSKDDTATSTTNSKAKSKSPVEPETNYKKGTEKATNPELTGLLSTLNQTLSSLQGTLATSSQQKEKNNLVGTASNAAPSTPSKNIQAATATTNAPATPSVQDISSIIAQTNTSNEQTGSQAQEAKSQVSEQQFPNGGMDYSDKVDTEKIDFTELYGKFEVYIGSLTGLTEEQRKASSVISELDKVFGKEGNNKDNVSQITLSLAKDLLEQTEKAEAAALKLKEFNENKLQNMRLVQLAEEQKLKAAHEKAAYDHSIAMEAAHAKSRDLQLNKDIYEKEALWALEEKFAAEESKRQEERINSLAEIEFTRAHADELRAKELHKKQLGYAEEYKEYLLKAGEYAVSQEEFEKNRKQKELSSAKKDATSGIVDAIKSGQFSKIWSADNKEAYTKYMGLRTTELEKSYMDKFDRKNPEATEAERREAKERAEASAKLTANFELVAAAAGNLAQHLMIQADKIGEKQAPIDTRLQGSGNDKILGSYWKQLARDMNKVGAVNPYFKQEDFASNIKTLVDKGISFDIKQRAFLMTIQEKIATTFDVADGTLLRLIRIQQQDTTAGRLGMESALNSFLNSMYETSEYLTDVASSVRSSLEEMQSLMEGTAATELEFQVQKWMGSLYSVGMSQEAVQNIARTFGQLASGDIEGLNGNGTSNLLIMAANEAGMSIADILQDGLDAKGTNKLMQAMVNYLAEIAETSKDSRVVQQQFANVFGVKASDLKAATSLSSSIGGVAGQSLSYGGMTGQLNKMANSMMLRTSTGEMLTNIWNNTQYTMATQMTNDPILYLLPRIATLLEDTVGGIDLPFVNAMGFGVDLNTSVAQLMNVAALSGSILGALGPAISGLASAVSGSAMLSAAGISTSGSAPVIARGSASILQNVGGSSVSESGYVGQSDGSAVKDQTLQEAEDSKKKQLVEAKDDSAENDVTIEANRAVINIYNLLEEVAHGTQSLRVKIVEDISGDNKSNGNWSLSFN